MLTKETKVKDTIESAINEETNKTEDIPQQNTVSKELPETSDIRIYPNPVADHFVIHSENIDRNLTFMIYDITGKMVLRGKLTSTEESISTNGLSNGPYVIKIFSGTQIANNIKLIINK
jgi:hypothetical protein